MRITRSALFAAVIAVGVAGGTAPGLAQAQQQFPTKPIRLVVAYTPGGQPDTLARMIGQKMSETWGRPVVVDNRPGAGGALAAGMVATAAPDGHTLLLAGVNFAASAALQPNLAYDPVKDFAGIGHIGFGTQALFVAPALGVKSVKDLIALAKAQPGKIIFASSAVGTGGHLTGERFRLSAGIKIVRVTFEGAPQAIIEILAGRSHYSITSLAAGLQFIREGKLLALAVNTPQRSPLLPDVPTLEETLPEFKRPEGSIGLLAPARTSLSIRGQVNKEIARILNLPDVKERMRGMGFAPEPSTPDEYEKILRSQIAMLSKLVRDAGLRSK